MMKRCKWRSRLIAVTLAIATWLLVTVPAQSTLPFNWEDNPWLQPVANRHNVQQNNVQQNKQQDSGQTVLLRVEGVLETGDLTFEDDSLYDVHPFEGESGQAITIRMISDEFDTYLILVNAEGEAIGQNDDTTSLETNSTLTILLPETGTYRIMANAFDATGQGSYQITVSIASDFEIQQVEADRLLLQGGQQYQVSQFQAALQSWQQALEIYQSIGSETAVYALSGIGNAYFSLGQYQQASNFYQQSLAMADDLGDRQAQATALGNLGLIYEALGQYQQAIESHQQSLAIDRAINNRRGEAVSLGNLGNVYYFLGQYQRAIEFHQQSLAINLDIGNRQGEAVSLGNLGLAHGALDQSQQAIEFHQQSLAINREIGNRQGENTTLDNLGSVYYSLGQYQQALDLYQQALDIALEISDRQGEGNLLVNLGEVHNALGQYQQALDLYQQALGIAREISDRQVEAIALNNLGSLFISTNQWAEAEIALTQSIEAYELLRTDLSDTQLISIADTQAATYAHLEKALTAQGKIAEALETTERARARAFVLQLASRLSNSAEPVAPDGSNLDGSGVVNPASIAEIQQIARDQNATLVTYSLIFDEALFIWVVQPSGEVEFRSVELGGSDDSFPNPIATIDGPVYRGNSDASELDTLVAETRAGIGVVANSIPAERLKDLHQILIDPIAELLPTDPSANVVFVPQGSLFLVPFAALQDADGTYLIQKHTVLTAPSIQVLGLVSRDAPGQSSAALLQEDNALVVGNPVMPEVVVLRDEGLQPIQLAPLPGAEAEALAISNFLNISPLIGNQATEAQIKQQLPTASLIHLATHGLLEYGDPQSSGVLDLPGALALTPGEGEDGLLTAAEILEIDLQAELAVLSACDTGRGRITGDGVVGLSRSLITAGVPSVIVSLWAVPDAPTAALMTEFYRQLDRGQTKVQALRQAMLATLNDSPEPINWAAFTLMGAIE